MEETMFDAGRRPIGRHFYWLLAVGMITGSGLTAKGAGTVPQTGPPTTTVAEQIELGGALELQHGDVSFTGSSTGVLGGLYAGAVSTAGCLAGFHVSPSGSGSTIQALINGLPTGTAVATTTEHRYVLTTFLYSMEVYRSGETYHSSLHPAGSGWGGAAASADVRFVLELQDIDPSNVATPVAPPPPLFHGVIARAPTILTYYPLN